MKRGVILSLSLVNETVTEGYVKERIGGYMVKIYRCSEGDAMVEIYKDDGGGLTVKIEPYSMDFVYFLITPRSLRISFGKEIAEMLKNFLKEEGDERIQSNNDNT